MLIRFFAARLGIANRRVKNPPPIKKKPNPETSKNALILYPRFASTLLRHLIPGKARNQYGMQGMRSTSSRVHGRREFLSELADVIVEWVEPFQLLDERMRKAVVARPLKGIWRGTKAATVDAGTQMKYSDRYDYWYRNRPRRGIEI